MSDTPAPAPAPTLDGGAYEVIRKRLDKQGAELLDKLNKVNAERQAVFGAVEPALIASDRITTDNNCTPRDMVALPDGRFLFGYNVVMGLRKETKVSDVLSVYEYIRDEKVFKPADASFLNNTEFQEDFAYLYRYYKNTVFVKFMLKGPHLFMAFRISDDVRDVKVFKWLLEEDKITYLGNRFDGEYAFPSQHEFEWTRAHRDMQRKGTFPHVSIDDRLFVETTGGDLTVKIEDNTETGEGIYSEPVEQVDQTLDDADIHYAVVGSLIILRIKPYLEKKTRYLVFNDKVKEVKRIDAIEHSCVLLPDDQGIIFANGYYLHSGEFKLFQTALDQMMFNRLVKSPNGEDYLYSFYNRRSGDYILMPYNVIEQKVETPIYCNGFTLFAGGEMVYFKTESEPQKHHSLQVWQTPFCADESIQEGHTEHFFSKLGNADIVKCMAACREVYNLLNKPDSYDGLYIDLVKLTNDIVDTWFWLGQPVAQNLKETVTAINATAKAAIDEFDKVSRIRAATSEQTAVVEEKARKLRIEIESTAPKDIQGYVLQLAGLRTLRGEIISLRDLRYVNEALCDKLEEQAAGWTQKTAQKTVDFLLKPEALEPYRKAVNTQREALAGVSKTTEADETLEALDKTGSDLELLIDIVGNLKIEDATQTTRIIDSISDIYSDLNQVKVDVKNRRRGLLKDEGIAQFNAQLKLLNQAVVNYLDIAKTPEQCDEYLTKVMIQLEELEGKYSEFDEFVEELSTKRDELYNAFNSRKVALQEARNQRATRLIQSSDRILKGIRSRAESLESINEINGYFASDLMVDKIRDLLKQLRELGEAMKADDLQTQLKTIQGDAIRQLKDKLELFVDGENIIQFGKHKFTVNLQELNLTTVLRNGDLFFHLTGTQFFKKISDPELLSTREVWDMEVISENDAVYRAEYLAYKLLQALEAGTPCPLSAYLEMDDAARLELIRKFMAPRYTEGYAKGQHDRDAKALLDALANIHSAVGLLRYHTRTRACALAFWHQFQSHQSHARISSQLNSFSEMLGLFPKHTTQRGYIEAIGREITAFCEESGLFETDLAGDAAEYLFFELVDQAKFTVSQEAAHLAESFKHELVAKRFLKKFEAAREAVKDEPASDFQIIRDWLLGYAVTTGLSADQQECIDEAAAQIFRGGVNKRDVVDVPISMELNRLSGNHPALPEGDVYPLNYNRFMQRLRHFERVTIPLFQKYDEVKKQLTAAAAEDLRLSEFEPRVLSSFVRNRLLDQVYLPLIGDNLAKQIGTAGEDSRTDRMGLLLLISPPGYGKTTLMEYIANRLGITFVKVNGPALGHNVVSLDPMESPNASAREEVEKLNLAFEMGDNVMIYLDDIQHCNPELLQKFISLCDGQRKIEGVFEGKARTYDLRGKKVAVVMAGNPYTETGGKFQIPDMLANRADTYNLGDIIGSSADAFKASYIENALTSNKTLNQLSGKSRQDVYSIMRIAETGTREGVEFESNFSSDAIQEMVSVMEKVMRVRDTILRVNLEYIRSAAQSDDYRTEPPFKLQGSYRNMNRITEKVLPIMTDAEVIELIHDHYENEAQTLTTGAEANLLKFKALEGLLTTEQAERWDHIKKTFKKNLLLGPGGDTDPVNKVVAQLSGFNDGLSHIAETLNTASQKTKVPDAPQAISLAPETLQALKELLLTRANSGDTLQKLAESLQAAQAPSDKTEATVHLAPKIEEQLTAILKAFTLLIQHTGIESSSPPAPKKAPKKSAKKDPSA